MLTPLQRLAVIKNEFSDVRDYYMIKEQLEKLERLVLKSQNP